MNETKKYAGLLDNKNARKAREERRTKTIVIPVTEAEKLAFEKHVKRGKRAEYCRNKILPFALMCFIGGVYGAILAILA